MASRSAFALSGMSAESCGKAIRTSPGSSADDGAASPVAAAPVSVPVVEGALGGTVAAVVVLPVFEAGGGGEMPPLLPPPAFSVEAVCVELPLAPEAGAVLLPRTEGGGGAIEGAVGGGEGGGGGAGEPVSVLVAVPPLLSVVEGA